MFSAEFRREEMAMTDARPQLVCEASSPRAAAAIAASILILLGIVFQLGEFAYGRLSTSGLWFVHMIAVNAWDLLAMRFGAPTPGEVFQYWPLALIGIGLAILLVLKPQSRPSARGDRR